MNKSLYCLIFLLIFSKSISAEIDFSKFTKQKVQNEVSKKSYCLGNDFYFLNNLDKNIRPKQILIETKQIKSWYTNLIKSFYSTVRSNWKINREFKKYKRANITLEFDNNFSCSFKGKIKIHGGRKDHINLKNLTSSLRVKLFNGHVNHSNHFGLLRPFTRNSDDEIFITTLLKELGFISPEVFYINVKLNNNKIEKMLFLDMDYNEILRKNNKPHGVVLAENKTSGFNKDITFSRVINVENQIYGYGWDYEKNFYLNGLDKTNFIVLNEKLNNKNILHNKDNYRFIKKDKFQEYYLLMLASGGDHGYQIGDRRYYYDIIIDKIEPVYYDWKPQLITNNYKFTKKQINFNFKSQNVDNLNFKLKNLNIKKIHSSLKEKGLSLNLQDVDKLRNKIIDNLLIIKNKKFEDNSDEKNIKFQYKNKILLITEQDNYKICDFSGKCDQIELSKSQLQDILETHEYDFRNYKIKFLRKSLDELKLNKIPQKHSTSKMNKLVLENNTIVYYNNDVEIKKNLKKIFFNFLNEKGRVILNEGNLKNYEFLIEGNKKNIDPYEDVIKIGDNPLPFCFALYNVNIENLTLKAKNLSGCMQSINFINSSGQIDNIELFNSEGDALKSELSNLEFKNIKISGATDDCIEFESGDYYADYVYLEKCLDKSIQLRLQAKLEIDEIQVADSLYGLLARNSSILKLRKSYINTFRECLIAYRENNEFYGSIIDVKNDPYCNNKNIYFQKGSMIKIKDVIQN